MQKCHDTEEKVAYRPFYRSFQDKIEALERKVRVWIRIPQKLNSSSRTNNYSPPPHSSQPQATAVISRPLRNCNGKLEQLAVQIWLTPKSTKCSVVASCLVSNRTSEGRFTICLPHLMPVSFWLSDCKIGNQSTRITVGEKTSITLIIWRKHKHKQMMTETKPITLNCYHPRNEN